MFSLKAFCLHIRIRKTAQIKVYIHLLINKCTSAGGLEILNSLMDFASSYEPLSSIDIELLVQICCPTLCVTGLRAAQLCGCVCIPCTCLCSMKVNEIWAYTIILTYVMIQSILLGEQVRLTTLKIPLKLEKF